jgi:hypothetical protein
MPKPNYAFAKRQRDLSKKQKKEEKRRRKLGNAQEPGADAPSQPDDGATTDPGAPGGTVPGARDD